MEPQNELTTYSILRGKVQLSQPKTGYRSGIDPIFLAASVPLRHGESALEVGTGVGTALLALAYRVPEARLTGLEMQRHLIRIAQTNILANSMHGRVDVMAGDLMTPPPRLAASSFSHVFSNPPYHTEKKAVKSHIPSKALSHIESSAPLNKWVDFCVRMVKPKGSVTIIMTAARLDELVHHMSERLGGIEVFPLWAKPGEPAKRVIVRGWKNMRTPASLYPGMVVHESDGRYSVEARGVLEKAHALEDWL